MMLCFSQFRAALAMALTLGVAAAAMAVPYASGVRNTSGTTWEFVLNEDADNVTVVRDGGNELNLATTKGRLTFDLGAFSAFDIQVGKSTAEAWTELTSGDIHTSFELPRGATVNRNPTNKYFGTVYVPNGQNLSTAVGRSLGDGVYSLTADLKTVDLSTPNWVVPDANDTTQAKGAAFMPVDGTITVYRVSLDEGGNLIVSDFTDASGGLHWMSPDMTTGGRLLGGTDSLGGVPADTGPDGGVYSEESDEFGLLPLHGSMPSKVYATGSVGNNLTVYGMDEDLDSTFSVPIDDRHSVWQWNIGDAAPDVNGNVNYQANAPELVIGSTGLGGSWIADTGLVGNGPRAIYSPQHDKWYLLEDRFNGGQTGILVVDPNEADPLSPTVLWDSLEWSRDPNGDMDQSDAIDGFTGNPAEPSGTISDFQDVFRHAGDAAISPDGTKLFLHKAAFFGANPALGSGAVVVIPLDENGVPDIQVDQNGTPLDTSDDTLSNVETIVILGNGVNHSSGTPMDVDAAGNIYVTNFATGAEVLQVFSPGGNWLTTTSGTAAALTSTAFSIVPLAPPGDLIGDYNNDGSVNAADYAVWRDNNGGTAVLPNDETPGTVDVSDYNTWRANFGETAGSGAGSGAVPEPSTIALALLSVVAMRGAARKRG